jgi:hypothetical protein
LTTRRNGYYPHTLTGKDGRRKAARVTVTICVASKQHLHRKTKRKHYTKLLYAVSRVRRTPADIRETYRRRFGIEVYQPECPSSAGLYQLAC